MVNANGLTSGVKTNYTIEEKINAPDSFEVKTIPNKAKIFDVKGKLVSFHGNKKMFDTEGNTVFSMSADALSRNYNMLLRDYRNNNIYMVRKKGLFPGKGRGTLQIVLGKSESSNPIIEMNTDFSRTTTQITDAGSKSTLAIITRKKFTGKRLFTGLDSYVIQVNPGVDIAFMVMLSICFDEQYTEGAF